MNVLTLARFTFREAVRKKVLLAALILSLVFLSLYTLGFYFFMREAARYSSGDPLMAEYGRQMGVLVIMGLYVVNFSGGLLAIFTAVGTIAGEIDSGTLHAVVPKPVGRWEIVVGKWLGYALMLSIYVFVMAWCVLGIAYFMSGYLPSRPMYGSLLMVLVTLLLLSMTIGGSTIFSTVTNGVVVFMLHGIASVSGMVEGVGTMIKSDLLVNIGIVMSLIVPSDALWKGATYFLQPRIFDLVPFPTPFSSISPPSTAMVVYAMGYSAAMVLIGVRVFHRRDL